MPLCAQRKKPRSYYHFNTVKRRTYIPLRHGEKDENLMAKHGAHRLYVLTKHRYVMTKRRRTSGLKFILKLVFICCLFIIGIIQWKISSFTILPRPKFFDKDWWKLRYFVGHPDGKHHFQSYDGNFSFTYLWNTSDGHTTRFRLFYKFFCEKYSIEKPPIKEWISGKQSQCGDTFSGYAKNFAYLKDVVVDPTRCHGRQGGEDMKSVMNQNENDEYMRFTKGVFTIFTTSRRCKKLKPYNFLGRNHLRKWFTETVVDNSGLNITNISLIVEGLTIAVQRYEYVNLYHTLTDWYNVFLMLMIFKEHPVHVTILWVDGHPSGGLDHVWTAMFNSVLRVGQLPGGALFKNLVWAIPGYFSQLMNHALLDVPYLEEFRHFVISSFGLHDAQKLDCSYLSILLIWRHNYVAHPRNPQGKLVRKIKNEDELITSLNTTFPDYSITGIQPDLYSFSKQLQYVLNTDILIGMHGAGLSLATFLPRNRALLELFPKYSSNLLHFKAIARWRNLYYENFKNTDQSNEFIDYYTRIPPENVIGMIKRARQKICSN